MHENTQYFLLGVLMGIAFGSLLWAAVYPDVELIKEGRKALQECEKSLPRDQYCHLTGEKNV